MAYTHHQSRSLESSQICAELIKEAHAPISVLYDPRYPPDYAFDIFVGSVPATLDRHAAAAGQNVFYAYAIVYTDKPARNWELVGKGKVEREEWQAAYRALEESVKELRQEFGTLTVAMEEWEKGSGKKANVKEQLGL